MYSTHVGTLELNDKVDITDPCYNKSVWCRMTTDCKPGLYDAYVWFSENKEYGNLVCSLSIKHKDSQKSSHKLGSIGVIGVDAGLAGFFNNKPDYSNDEWREMCDEYWCKKDENGETQDYWMLDYGVVSSSGVGDGSYEVYTNKERDIFEIRYL